jgi:hypothetical protein
MITSGSSPSPNGDTGADGRGSGTELRVEAQLLEQALRRASLPLIAIWSSRKKPKMLEAEVLHSAAATFRRSR